MTHADPTLALVRPVGCHRFRWRPGMRAQWRDGSWWRLLDVAPDGLPLRAILDDGEHALWAWGMPGAAGEFVAIDVDDDATRGCLLALVREAWDTAAHLVRLQTNDADGQGGTKPACWWALALGLQSVPFLIDGHRYLAGPTEAEALVAALEAAP